MLSKRQKKRPFPLDRSPTASRVRMRIFHTNTLSLPVNRGSDSFEDEQANCGETVTLMLDQDVLYRVFKLLPAENRFSVQLVCKRWRALGAVAFNEFETTKSFLHALYVDPSRLYGMSGNPRLLGGLLKDGTVLHAVCQKVTCRSLLTEWLARLDDARWTTCVLASVKYGNTAAIEVLFSMIPGTLAEVSTVARSVVKAAFDMRGVPDSVLVVLLSCVLAQRRACGGGVNGYVPSFVTMTCCLSHKEGILRSLLAIRPPVFAHVNLLYVLNYAADHSNLALAESAVACLGTKLDVPGDAILLIVKKACKRGWDHISSRLLPAEEAMAAANNNNSTKPAAMDLTVLLRHAAITGNAQSVKLLLARRDVSPGRHANSIIRESLEMGHVGIACMLLNDKRVSVLVGDSQEKSVLCCAIRSGQDASMIGAILDACPAEARLEYATQFNRTPLRLALESRNCDAVRVLLTAFPEMYLTKGEVMAVLGIIGGMSVHADLANRLIHDRRFARYFDWNT